MRVAVRLTPKAASDRIDGLAAEADGGTVLKVGVTAVPENGKANAALVKLLAKAWKVPKGTIIIAAGTTDRRKTLHIATDNPGDAEALGRRLEGWMREHG